MDHITVSNAAEFIANAGAFGANLEGPSFHANSTLRRDQHERIDGTLMEVARQRLTAVADLQSRGLVENLGGIGVMLSTYERVGDMTDAGVSMDGMTLDQNDRLTFDEVSVPIPIIHKDWQIGARQLAASARNGTPLSVTQLSVATRIVAERIDGMIFNGLPDFKVDSRSVYGYCNFPDRNTVALSGAGWNDSSNTNFDPIGDTKNLIESAAEAKYHGPFLMYVSRDIWLELQMDYSKVKGDKTYLQRILDFAEINEVKPSDSMKDNEVVLVQMTPDVIDFAVGVDIRNIEWGQNPMQLRQKVFAACAPRPKSDKDGQCGIVHGSI